MFCVMPPKSLWAPFVRIKSRHFAAKLRKRGKSPFPHITLAQAIALAHLLVVSALEASLMLHLYFSYVSSICV